MKDENRCESCGTPTVMPVTCCGQCAWNWNTPDGKKSINLRRKVHGLPPLKEEK